MGKLININKKSAKIKLDEERTITMTPENWVKLCRASGDAPAMIILKGIKIGLDSKSLKRICDRSFT